MSCILRITGDFRPEDFIENVALPLEIRHRKGEIGRKGAVEKSSLVQITVSHAEFSGLHQQFDDMSRFVARNEDALKELCRRDEITSCTFDFGGQFDPVSIIISRSIPRRVVMAAATCNASIEISLYSKQAID